MSSFFFVLGFTSHLFRMLTPSEALVSFTTWPFNMDKDFLNIETKKIMRRIHKYICINMHICMIFQICIYSLAFHWNQTNLLIHFLNIFCKIIIFLPTPGVYELVIFEMKPGGPPLWGNAFKRAINAHVDLGYSKLIGVFHTEYGALNRGTVVHFF